MDTSSLVSSWFTQLSYWFCHYNYLDVVVVDTHDDASMDGTYVAYFDDEHVDNHEFDNKTDDDH